MSNQTSIKYPGANTSISKVHVNNMYIKYTFVYFAILLIRQILGAVLLPVSSPFAVEELSFRLWSRLGLLPGSSNFFTILLEVPLLSLALFLETSGLANHQQLMVLLDFYLRNFEHCEELGNSLFHPLHIIVLHEAFIAWWQCLKNYVNNTII